MALKVAVRYYSKQGSTQKLAEAIAEELKISDCADTNELIFDPVDILFIGGAVYKFDIDFELASFIKALDKELVKNVAIFSISSGAKEPYDVISEAVKAQGINVIETNYFCKGKFMFMNAGHPNIDDLAAVKSFAKKVVTDYIKTNMAQADAPKSEE